MAEDSSETRPSAGGPSEWQVKLRVDKRFQKLVAFVLCSAALVDILGTVLIAPGLPGLCVWAEGGPAEQMEALVRAEIPAGTPDEIVLAAVQQEQDRLISPHAFKGDNKPPFKYSLSMNVVMSLSFIGSAVGSVFFGMLADRIGCKIPMIVCLAGGLVGYVLMYLAAVEWSNYWLFALGMVWNNFFGVVTDLAFTYFGKMFDGEEREAYQGIVSGMAILGGAVGSAIVMPFANSPENGANYFKATWLAMGLTVVALISVVVLVPKAPRFVKDDPRKDNHVKAPDDPSLVTPPRAKRLIWILIIAAALDVGGDEGTRMARSTILPNIYPQWSTVARNNYLMFSLLLQFGIAMTGLFALNKVFNKPTICVIGVFFTMGTQLLLMIELDEWPFIAVWYLGKLLGTMSTMGANFALAEVAPKALLGYWNGIFTALANVAMSITPLVFSGVYDAVGNNRGQEMLACTASISFVAMLAYVPAAIMMPTPVSVAPSELKELEYYENLSDAEWGELPMRIVDQVTEMMMEAGKPPRSISWGCYSTEREKLYDLQSRAVKDFEYYSNSLMKTLCDRERLLKEQKLFAQFIEEMPAANRDKAKQEMGAWLADYFDDAGYVGWENQATFYKAMIMSAFPPIDVLNEKKAAFHTQPIEVYEENMTKILQVMDNHLATEKRRIAGLNKGALASIRRR